MQETKLEKDLDPEDYPSWWKRILIGAVLGGFFGLLNIWFYEFSRIRLLASILGGATFFAIFGLLAVNCGNDKTKVMALAGFAGFAAGAVYWVVARPSSSPLLAIAIGMIGGGVYAWVELKD